jgi:hypothetical protein
MYARNAQRAEAVMTDDPNDVIMIVTDRFERRLTEESSHLRIDMTNELGKVRADMASESGKLRAEMAHEFGKVRTEMATGFGAVRAEMADGFGKLRAEMIDRNAELLKWGLVFGATQTAALAAVMALLR